MDQCDVFHPEIVEKVSVNMPAQENIYNLSDFFKMFSDSTRVAILCALEINEMCVCDLASVLQLTKSAVSHQLKALRLSNLVKYRKDGKNVFYSLADDHVSSIIKQGFEHIGE